MKNLAPLLLLLLFSCNKETLPEEIQEIDPCEGLPPHHVDIWEKGIIPYFMPPSEDIGEGWIIKGFDKEADKNKIRKALKELSESTGLLFPEYESRAELLENHENGIEVRPSMINNSSDIGKAGGIQKITFIAESSFTPEEDLKSRSIKHEFLHAAGFEHMAEHSDRDNYIIVHWDNIRSGMVEAQFQKRESPNAHDCGRLFDLHSIMMYGSNQGVKNKDDWQNYPSMTTIDGELIIQSQDVSQGDIDHVWDVYKNEFAKR